MITQIKDSVKEIYENYDASHDFQHIERVLQNAEAILETEPTADKEVVRLAALLHDVSDKKYTDNKDNENRLIDSLNISEEKRIIFVK